MGDSYGIHEAQQQGNSHAGYVNDYNDKVRAHNQGALKDYQTAQTNLKSGKDMLQEVEEWVNLRKVLMKHRPEVLSI